MIMQPGFWFDPLDALLVTFTAIAVIVSILAWFTARRANALVGVYERAVWEVETIPQRYPSELEDSSVALPGIALRNMGRSPAQQVVFTLDADPLHIITRRYDCAFIPAGSHGRVLFNLPELNGEDPTRAAIGMFWKRYFQEERVRMATVSWLDLENKWRHQRVSVPPEWAHPSPAAPNAAEG